MIKIHCAKMLIFQKKSDVRGSENAGTRGPVKMGKNLRVSSIFYGWPLTVTKIKPERTTQDRTKLVLSSIFSYIIQYLYLKF